ncbi:MAG: roadblock/LC7 domain-containing protein [Thermocladium sp.]
MAVSARLDAMLDGLLRDLGGDGVGAILVRRDGLPVAQRFPPNIDTKTVAALSMLAAGALRRLGTDSKLGDLEYALIHYTGYMAYLDYVTPDIALIAVVNRNANLGLLLLVTDQYMNQIKQAMSIQ